jgi:serine/threonine protein kinase/tetratricopeptide (TPR) repeat protein
MHGRQGRSVSAGAEPDLSQSEQEVLRPWANGIAGYRPTRLLARGGFGTVLVANRDTDGERVVLKLARPDAIGATAQLRREGQAMLEIAPPIAPRLFSISELPDQSAFLVMELIELPTLAQRLQQLNGPAPFEEFTRWGDSFIQALERLHQRGWVHLDLKPENVFIGDDGEARFCDFGLASQIGSAQAQRSGSRPMPGTPAYMSPEQWAGHSAADPRSDVYAAGVILFELLTGRTPFSGTGADLRDGHARHRPPRPSELLPVSPEVESVILTCLAKDPSRRFGSASALRSALHLACAPSNRGRLISSLRPASQSRAIERQPVALLFISAPSVNPLDLQRELARFGAELAEVSGDQAVAAVDGERCENPVDRAVATAEALLQSRQVAKVLIDVARIPVQRRSDGSVRYMSKLFRRSVATPDLRSPVLTRTALALVPHLQCRPISGSEDLSELRPASRVDASATFSAKVEPLIGREHILQSLRDSAQRALHHRVPTIASVLGEQLVGKSHLAAALVAQLRAQFGSGSVIALKARSPLPGSSDDAYREILCQALSLSAAELKDGRILVSALEKNVDPALARELGVRLSLLLGRRGAEAGLLDAAPGAVRALMIRALGSVLQGKQRGICVVVDDAHFADSVSLDSLEFAALQESGRPIWVCAFSREVFATGRPGWGERAARHERHDLPPLSDQDGEALCRQLLRPADNVPAKAVEKLISRTHGFPGLLVELIRGLKRDDLIRKHADGASWFLVTDELDRLPDLPTIEWLAHWELQRLPAHLASHAQLAASLDVEFSVEQMEGVLLELERASAAGEFPLDAAVAVQQLLDLGILAPKGARRAFRNSLLRDAAARSLPEASRRNVHLAAFRYFRALPESEDIEAKGRLAFHAGAAGLKSEAASLYLSLAEDARNRHAYFQAESLYSRALSHLGEDDSDRQLMACRGRGIMRYRLGRYDDSISDLRRAQALAEQSGHTELAIEILLDQSMGMDWIGQYEQSKSLMEKAAELVQTKQIGSRLIQSRLLLAKGRSELRFSRWACAADELERAIAMAEALGPQGYETLVVSLLMMGPILPSLGRLEGAKRAFDRVLTLCETHSDRLHLVAALNNRRYLWTALENVEEAVKDQLACVQIGRELGLVHREIDAEGNLGEILYLSGDLERARNHVSRAVELERQHREATARPSQLLLQARLYAYQGRRAEALGTLAEIEQRIASSGHADRPLESVLVPSEQVLFSMVRLATAESTPAAWASLVARARVSSVEQELIEVLEMAAVCMKAQRRFEEAREFLHHALEACERIPNIMRRRVERQLQAVEKNG